ncbi:MAG: efflux RND transporter periplasmic adaptor subunit [Treponema sp.]|jgi:Cu(I)/Ag(I) efflux system membrane fusion protein|nr:efflux RND transporter periplasmic adaptor subunit [Treponema sp.]
MNRGIKIIGGAVIVLVIAGIGFYFKVIKPQSEITMTENTVPASRPIVVSGDTVTLDERARQLAGIQTARAAVRNLRKDIKTTGKIVINERARTYLTSRVEGRLERLYAAVEGEYIYPGQVLGEVYSPAYIAAQEEYLQLLDGTNAALQEAARRRLSILNVPDSDIRRLEQAKQAREYMPIYAQFGGIVLERQMLPGVYIRPGDRLYSLVDLSTAWITADIYEKDIANVRTGQEALITSQAYPGETFTGKVVFISPVLDDVTRTLKVRVELDNSEGKLKPNMFVGASIRVPLGESIVIPETSILEGAEGQMVFWAQNENTFVRHAVQAGQYANGYVQILSGIDEGDIIVSAAAFLLDSQTKLGALSSHGGHGGASSGGHN